MNKYVATTNPWPYDFEVLSAQGSYFKARKNGSLKAMFDMSCGISVNNLGHRDSAIVDAVSRVEEKYAHLMVYGEFDIFEQSSYAEALCKSLKNVVANTIDDHLQVWFTTSGTEANELAMKLALLTTHRDTFSSVKGGFHGRTLGSLSITSRESYRKPFMGLVQKEKFQFIDATESYAKMLKGNAPAAVIFELIRGEDGVKPLSHEEVETLTNYADMLGSLVIVDEVQTGFGRSGTLWASEQYGVESDIMVLGKACGGGYPMGAVVARKSIFDAISTKNPFTHLSTFGGNPIACAAGLAMLNGVSDPLVLKNTHIIENIAKDIFSSRPDHYEIRGKGAMLGLDLNPDKCEDIDKVIDRIWDNGVFVGRVLHDNRTIRLYPPLNSNPTQVLNAFEAIEGSI